MQAFRLWRAPWLRDLWLKVKRHPLPFFGGAGRWMGRVLFFAVKHSAFVFVFGTWHVYRVLSILQSATLLLRG